MGTLLSMRRLTGAIAALVLLCTTWACNTSGCTDNQNSLPLAGFYTTGTLGKPIEITLDSVEIGGVGAPGDSLLYGAGTPLQSAYLPLRSTAQTTSFYIHYAQQSLNDPALNDTITFGYTSTPYFASEECGAMYHYHIDRMTHTSHLIDSVVITDSLITNTDTERIRIFFRTASE